MLEGLGHDDRIRGTGFDTEIAKSAEFQVIYQFIDRFLLFSFRGDFEFGHHFDGTIGAGQFTGRTARAAVLVVVIVAHHHLAAEAFRQHQRGPVVRVLLGDDLLVVREVIAGQLHAGQQIGRAHV